MIDSHAHLIPDFVKNIDELVENARSSGLEAIINSAIEPHHYEFATYLEKKNPCFIYTTLGFSASHFLADHPTFSTIHGHNYGISVNLEIKDDSLNKNSMVIDFHTVKKLVNDVIESMDHKLLIPKYHLLS